MQQESHCPLPLGSEAVRQRAEGCPANAGCPTWGRMLCHSSMPCRCRIPYQSKRAAEKIRPRARWRVGRSGGGGARRKRHQRSAARAGTPPSPSRCSWGRRTCLPTRATPGAGARASPRRTGSAAGTAGQSSGQRTPTFRCGKHTRTQRARNTHSPPVFLYPWVDIPAFAFR